MSNREKLLFNYDPSEVESLRIKLKEKTKTKAINKAIKFTNENLDRVVSAELMHQIDRQIHASIAVNLTELKNINELMDDGITVILKNQNRINGVQDEILSLLKKVIEK